MADGFISLAAVVRAATQVPLPTATREIIEIAEVPPAPFLQADVVAELSLLRLAAIEAFELGVPRLLELVAREVLGRELLLAPADIDALVRRALTTFAQYEPVAISVAACDRPQVRSELPVRVDPQLRAGDLAIEVRDGAFESHFLLRLEHAIERARQAA